MEEIVTLSKVMGDINRVKIVALIAREGDLCVCEICDTLQLSQPLVSRYLKQLKAADVLEGKKEGKWVHYRIVPQKSILLQAYLDILEEKAAELPELVHCAVK